MVDYLDRIGAGLIIAHPEMLDFDHVPETLVGREDIQRELASKFSNVASPEGAARAVITGPVGSGKTVLAKTFCRDLQRHLSGKRELKVAHINCRNASTSMRVAQRILTNLTRAIPTEDSPSEKCFSVFGKCYEGHQHTSSWSLTKWTTCYVVQAMNCSINCSELTRTKTGLGHFH